MVCSVAGAPELPSISICIPTHRRATLLAEALESAIRQTLPASEIIVSDDCGDTATRKQVEAAANRSPVPIRYIHCQEGIGQAENVNHCFLAVNSELLVLIHDDDLLLPTCLEILIQPFLADPQLVAAYGCQEVIESDGTFLPGRTQQLNRQYHRTAETAGRQPCSFCASVRGQFPNNGYLLRTRIAQEVLYDPAAGDAADVDFGIRCAQHGAFHFINEPVSKYRLSVDSITRGAGLRTDNSAFRYMEILEGLRPVDPDCRATVCEQLKRLSPAAIAQAAQLGHAAIGWRWFLSPPHWARMFSLGGGRRAVALLVASARLSSRPKFLFATDIGISYKSGRNS